MASPLPQSPAARVALSVKRKYQRIRSRPSPLSDQVRCRLLGKLKSVSSNNSSVSDPNDSCLGGKISRGELVSWYIILIKRKIIRAYIVLRLPSRS